MKSFVIVTIVFIGVFAYPEDDYRIIDSIYQESPCSSQGGICTIGNDCPTGRLHEKQGLCPKQQARGVECCYGLSVKETRCQKHGGECFKEKAPCGENLTIPKNQSIDCPEDTICCVLVK